MFIIAISYQVLFHVLRDSSEWDKVPASALREGDWLYIFVISLLVLPTRISKTQCMLHSRNWYIIAKCMGVNQIISYYRLTWVFNKKLVVKSAFSFSLPLLVAKWEFNPRYLHRRTLIRIYKKLKIKENSECETKWGAFSHIIRRNIF